MAGLCAVLLLAAPVQAQNVSSADIQRLQDEVYQAGADLSRMRTTNSTEAARLQDELDTLRDEVIYLKVKLRKDTVTRREYTDLRDQLQDFRSRARGETPSRGSSSGSGEGVIFDDRPRTSSSTSSTTTSRTTQSGIPAGTEIDVRIQSELTSDTAQVEDRFEATTVVDLSEGDRVLIPAGSVMRGLVTSVNRASRTDRKGSLTVAFNQVTVRGRNYPMRGTVTEAIESEGIRGEAARIGAGSAVGAVIGGIIGGVKGALLGVLIGGGGTMVATEGKDVHVPAGTILRVRMDTPPEIR
ncbi:MAG TPA: hypothetical protein VFJ02_25365 [Vicinamibacterales bacterium]|nr:hypothetical protein [Vicinamibacterales bacterium]